MKHKITLIIIFIVQINVFSQNGVVHYKKEISYSAKITKSIGLTKSMNKTMEKVKEVSKGLNYILKFNSEKSLFNLEKRLTTDDYSRINLLSENLGGKGEYYTNIKDKTVVNRKEFYGDMLNVKKNYVDLSQWQLTSESKKIGNYTCYKAIYTSKKERENNIVVWFAPDIPYNYGPLEYSGFPGLVLCVELVTKKGNNFLKFKYEATKIYLKKDSIEIPEYKNSELITQEEYMKILKGNYLSTKRK